MTSIYLLLLLPSEIAVIKIKASTRKTEPGYHGNATVYFNAKAAVGKNKQTIQQTNKQKTIKIVAYVEVAHSASAKIDPLLPGFCHHSNILFLNQRSSDE